MSNSCCQPACFTPPAGFPAGLFTLLPWSVETIADLRNLSQNLAAYTVVEVLGYWQKGDGGGGMFWYNPTSTQPSNSWLNFLPSNPSVPGCWFRQYDNGPVNVLWAGIKGDGVFDNTSRLQLLQNNCFWGVGVEPRTRLELYFPIGTYLTGKINFYGINLSGDNLLTTAIVSKPGEDIFYFPDPTLYETGSLSANIDFFIVKNLTFRMDCSQHGTFPNRTYWPVTGNWSAGLTVADGFYYIASGNVYLCTDGGVTGSVPPTHTTGVAIDGSVKWYYVDNGQKTYGAAAFACPLSNGQLANSIPVQFILHPRFENVTVCALDHGLHPSTNECGFYIQRPIYGGTWDKCTVRFLHGGWITAATNLYPNAYDWAPDTNNWFGCDTFCDIPFRMFGGSHGTVVGLSVYATGVGQRCIELFPFAHVGSGLRPAFWSFVGLYQEPNVASTGPICIIGGYKNVIDSMELSFGSSFTDFLGNNNKISSAWMPNYGATAPTIRIFGDFNSIEDLKIGTGLAGSTLPDVVNDQGSGNRVLFADVDSYPWRSERTVSTIGNRPPMGFLTNEFLMKGNYSKSFYDMLVGGREFYASAGGDPLTPVADKTLETGGYGRRTVFNGSVIWPDSAGSNGNHIGSRFPAAKCRFIVKGRVGIPCNSYIVPSVVTPSLVLTNVAVINPSWTTAWSIFSVDVDLSAYGLSAAGGPYRFCPLFSIPDISIGQVQDIAWWALVPYAQENSVIVNRYPGGIVDTYGSGTPEGALVAPIGSTYRRSDGSAGTSFYVKRSGTSNTGWVSDVSGALNVFNFGAKGDGVTNDTAAIQATIDAAGSIYSVYLPKASYLTGALTLVDGSQIQSNGASLLANANSITVITVPNSAGGLQAGLKTQLINLSVEGNGKSGVTGISVLNNDNFFTQTCTVNQCVTGWKMVAMQFATHIRPKAWDCTVGFYLKNDAVGGGGNSNSFYDLQAVGNKVGFIMNQIGTFPMGANYLWNASLLGNDTCGLAVFSNGLSDSTIYLDGSANEANGGGSGPISYDGLSIKLSSIYCYGSEVNYANSVSGEASINPCILVENAGKLILNNVTGYGIANGKFVSATASSKVLIYGDYGAIGGVDNVSVFNSTIRENGLLALPVSSVVDTSIPNDVVNPQIGDLQDTTGAMSTSLGTSSILGEYREVVFYPTVPTSESNRSAWHATFSASGVAVVSVNVLSNLDTTLVVGLYGNLGMVPVNVKAGVHYRLLWYYDTVTAGAYSLIISPNDAVGATVRFSRWHITSESANTAGGFIARVSAGVYNPKIAVQRPQYSANAAPTVGTWIVGDTVNNSVPASGGNIGWVCTTAGTPGTWNTFGAIS